MIENEINSAEKLSNTIMVVDDDDISRKTTCKVLEKNGYRVIECNSGKLALEEFNQTRPDLVLLDVIMPEMDGYEVCARLRELMSVDTLPVLMLTGLNDIDATNKAFDTGATDFITKPINWSLLAERVRYALRACENISELKEKQKQLEAAQEIARLGYWRLDLASGAFKISGYARKILGFGNDQSISLDQVLELTHPDDYFHVNYQINHAIANKCSYQIEHRLLYNNGQDELIIRQQGSIYNDDEQGIYLLGVIQDVTEGARKDEEIEYKTFYDDTTGLPNRYYFESQCRKYIHGKNGSSALTGFYFIRIDHLNKINESLSHAYGNKLLKKVAQRLGEFEQGGHIIAHFSHDLFSVMVRDIDSIDDSDQFIKYLLDRITAQYKIDEHDIHITASVGVSLYPLDSTELDDIIKYADAASAADNQTAGNQFQYHTAEMTNKASHRFLLEKELRQALDKNEIQVYYQPQIDAHNYKITGMEALVRWHHPERGIVSPADFIPIAEDTGLIIPIGNWVMQQACVFAKQFSDEGRQLRVGVNLSPQQFRDVHLKQVVEQSLMNSSLSPDLLEIEITESMAMFNVEDCISILHAIKELGIHISMDDFGTGYSSLNYLQAMPLDTLKVDQSFIRRIDEQDLIDYECGKSKNAAIVAAIISMAHSLGLNVISEGVETEPQQRLLSGLGSEILQGFLFSKPLPADQFIAFIRNYDSNLHNSSGKKSG